MNAQKLHLLAALLFAMGGGASCGAGEEPCDLIAELGSAECDTIRSFELPEDLPPARGNAWGDDPGAANLGFAMFYDARLSANQEIRCASCHLPERKFHDGKPRGEGLEELPRNTPTLLNAARLRTFHWDGRADSLWSQALLPLQSPAEMGYSVLELAHRIDKSYKLEYEAVFGPLPPIGDASRFPAEGGPGSPAFEGMTEADRDAILRVAANTGKAFEAYERKLAAGLAPLDRFLGGDTTALTGSEQRGLIVFLNTGCANCHSGPLLSDESFHNLGFPIPDDEAPDHGWETGYSLLATSPFNAQGPYWDGPPEELPEPPTEADLGAFRTPSLRNVAVTAPYGHDGRFAELSDVVDFHLRGGGLGDPNILGAVDSELEKQSLSAADKDALLSFLGALTGDYPAPPWNNWPDK